jgi:hypothetical protein
MNLDDVLRDRLAVVKAQRDRAKGAPDRAKEHSASNPNRSAADRALQPHGERELHNWLGALPESLFAAIATIEVDDRQVRTQGSNDLLEKAILARAKTHRPSVRRRVLSGAPVGIKMRTPILLSFLSNFGGEVCRYRLWLWLILGARGGPYERVRLLT